jgi:hypothetical protein
MHVEDRGGPVRDQFLQLPAERTILQTDRKTELYQSGSCGSDSVIESVAVNPMHYDLVAESGCVRKSAHG